MTLTILLVDDSRPFLTAVQTFLGTLPCVRVIGLAMDGHSALEKAEHLQPDLVLLDVAMPGMNGFEVAEALNARPQPPRIVFLSLHDNAAYRALSSVHGAVDFVSKGDFSAQLVPLLEVLAAAPGAASEKCA